ncbi:MAG: hypothetical protein GY737_13895 [Desulfobacteraceae bacterium]|nr:hypothetical protein [Desulfobacteraceae bacterium]
MIEIKTPQQLVDDEQQEFLALQEAQARQNRPIITSLAAYVRDCWQASKEAKVEIERRMIEALRQKKGRYDPQKLAAIQENGGSAIFMLLTDEKCAAAVAWLTDILFPSDDKPWGTKPTPVPDLSPEQMTAIQQRLAQEMQTEIRGELIMNIQAGKISDPQQAQQWLMQAMKARAENLAEELRHEMTTVAKEARLKVETKLEDVVEEAGWEDAVQEAMDDIVTFPAGIVKGPVLRRRKKIRWKKNQPPAPQQQGAGYPELAGPPVEVREEIVIEFNRVSPFDIYPLPNAKCPGDGLIERHKLSRADLQALIGVEGYDDEAIKLVLQNYGRSGNWLNVGQDQTRQELEDRPNEWRSPNKKIDALQLWGSVQGLMLLENGMPPEHVPDPLAEYQVEVWLIDQYVIKSEINGDPLGRVPYHFASFRKRNGSLWGAGVPELIKDSQDACNASARNLINNMGISSGPQAVYDISQLANGQNMTEIRPWKIWQVDGSKNVTSSTSRPPVSFFVPPSMAEQLMKVYEFFSNEADTKTGVPKYSYGNNKGSGGALSTASGFSMMMNNASRGIKNVVRNIDKGIIKPSIQMTHEWELLYSGDPEYYVGDIKLIARGSNALIAKEQAAVRRNEFLQIAVNPIVLQIIGQEGLAAILREIVEGMDFTADEIVPTKEVFAKRLQSEAVQAQAQAQIAAPEQGKEVDGAGAVQGGRDAKIV